MSNDLEARLAKLTRNQLLALVQGMCRRSADRPVSFAAFAEEEVERFCGRVEAADVQAADAQAAKIRAVLEEFVQDIESTGGVADNEHGLTAPVADPEWSDLGETYGRACRVLGRKPVYTPTATGESGDGD